MIIRIGDSFINLDKVNCIKIKSSTIPGHPVHNQIDVYFGNADYVTIEGYNSKEEAINAILNADKIEFTTAHDKELEQHKNYTVPANKI